MKKIIILIISFFILINNVNADIALPYKDECAKYVITEESKKKYDICINECIKESWDEWMCEKYSCWWQWFCTLTNWEAIKLYILSFIILSTTWFIIYKKRKKKNDK